VGLTAVQHLIRHIGGSVTLVSEEGEGAVFTLRFPVRTPSPVGQSPETRA
jgi:signal transduction histidine kinase